LVFLREHRHEGIDADLQYTLAQSARPEPGGPAPVAAGLWALATLLQAYGHVGERDAVARTVMAKRWQRGLDGRGAAQPPVRQGTLGNCRRRRIAHHLDKTLRERTVAWAAPPGGVGARPRRAVLASPPLCGAGRGADTLPLRGHARRQAVGLAAQALGTSAEAVVADAGRVLVGPSRRKAALALGLAAVARWPRWRAPPQTLAAAPPPLHEVMETSTQRVTQATEPDPGGGPGGRRRKPPGAPARRLSSEAHALRPGRTRRAQTCQGFQAHVAVAVESTGIREVVVRPAHAPEQAAVALLAEEVEKAPGRLQLARALGAMASPRMAQGAAQGVSMIARPWPHVGPRCTQHECPLDFAGMQGPCPGGQRVPRLRGTPAQFPAAAGDGGAVRSQGTTATQGPGRSLRSRADEPCQQKLRTKMKTPRGRAALRTRTAVAPAMAHQVAHPGRRARYNGLRNNPCEGRRHAAVSNLQVAAHYEEEHRLAS
jgi:hypothetical protein